MAKIVEFFLFFRKKFGLTRHNLHCTSRNNTEQLIQEAQCYAESTQQPVDFETTKTEYTLPEVKSEVEYAVLTQNSQSVINKDLVGNQNLCNPSPEIKSYLEPPNFQPGDISSKNHGNIPTLRYSDIKIEDIQMNSEPGDIRLNLEPGDIQLNPEPQEIQLNAECQEIQLNPVNQDLPRQVQLNSEPVEMEQNPEPRDNLVSDGTSSRTVFGRIESESTMYIEESTVYCDESTVYSTEIRSMNMEQEDSQSPVNIYLI